MSIRATVLKTVLKADWYAPYDIPSRLSTVAHMAACYLVSMHSRDEDIERVVLVLKRLLDADLLLPDEAEPLLSQAQAVIELRDEGGEEALQRRLEELARAGEALVRADLVAPPGSQALAEAVRLLKDGGSG